MNDRVDRERVQPILIVFCNVSKCRCNPVVFSKYTESMNTFVLMNQPLCKIGAAPSVAEAIGTQSVKVLLVHMCLCLVGTHKSMLNCMNLSMFYWCVF